MHSEQGQEGLKHDDISVRRPKKQQVHRTYVTILIGQSIKVRSFPVQDSYSQ